jgi:hypothetical protein
MATLPGTQTECLKTIDLLWIPFALQVNPANPHQLITTYGNGLKREDMEALPGTPHALF